MIPVFRACFSDCCWICSQLGLPQAAALSCLGTHMLSEEQVSPPTTDDTYGQSRPSVLAEGSGCGRPRLLLAHRLGILHERTAFFPGTL